MKRHPRRKRYELREWTFLKGRIKTAWLRAEIPGGETIRLPHSWNAEDTWKEREPSYRGKGGYRCIFHVPENGLRHRLVAEGYYGLTEIFLDGRKLCRVDPQFLGWKIPLPEGIRAGAYILGLRMDNFHWRGVLPDKKLPDFLLHGGLMGRIHLEEYPPLRLDEEQLRLRWNENSGAWEISIEGRVARENSVSPEEPISISWAIEDGEGRLLAASENVEAGRVGDGAGFRDSLRCPGLEAWSPSSPRLYFLRIHLWRDDEIADEMLLRFGLTVPEFRKGEGFFLNGERLRLHGVNRHESIPGLGGALPTEIQRADAEVIRALGANFVRLSHYPQSEAFLDACDELGLMVYPEIATWKSVSSRRKFREAAVRQMEAMILRDRHRPSILCWGMGNESRSARTYLQLGELIHDLDPVRPSVYAENHLYRARRKRTIGIPDVWGINYEIDVAGEARDASVLKNVIITECCNHPHSRRGTEEEELRQLIVIERDWDSMEKFPWLTGYAVWCYADYATEYRQRVHRLAGLHDAWRQPKMAAELFRARHSDEAVLSLFVTAFFPDAPHSSFRQEIGEPSPGGAVLHVFSNCGDLEALIDGSTVTLESSGQPHRLLYLKHPPESIELHSPSSGLRASWRRPGPPSRIEIRPPAEVVAAGRTFPLKLRVVDEKGRLVHGFSGKLRVRVHGPVELRTFNPEGFVEISRGEGRVFLRAGFEEARIEIRVSGERLPAESIRLEISEPGRVS